MAHPVVTVPECMNSAVNMSQMDTTASIGIRIIFWDDPALYNPKRIIPDALWIGGTSSWPAVDMKGKWQLEISKSKV
jgi:hypothetical protein